MPLAEACISHSQRATRTDGTGLISLWPHPCDPASLALIIAGNDDAGMERAARLFPIRTGVPVCPVLFFLAACVSSHSKAIRTFMTREVND